jgi:hypothetical protein
MLFLAFFSGACSLSGLAFIKPTSTSAPLVVATQSEPVPTEILAPVTTSAPVQSPLMDMIPRQESSDSPRYSVDLDIPYLIGEAPGETSFNERVGEIISSELDSFKALAVENEPWRLENMPEIGSYLEMSYEVTYLDNTLVSTVLYFSAYLAGAAHPNSYTYTVTIDLASGRELGLGDLFLPGTDYLSRISEICVQELTSREALMFPEGAYPTEENYRLWNISPEGLGVRFDPYQIAPYALGPQNVMVPFDSLSNLIDPAGLLVNIWHKR